MDDGAIDEGDIRWVLTVPAIWRQPAKQFMRQAAYKVQGKLILTVVRSSEMTKYLIRQPKSALVVARRTTSVLHQIQSAFVAKYPRQRGKMIHWYRLCLSGDTEMKTKHSLCMIQSKGSFTGPKLMFYSPKPTRLPQYKSINHSVLF